MRRTRLATRIALLSVGIAVVTALIAGALSIGLIRTSSSSAARTTLARLADVAQTVADRNGNAATAQLRLRTAFGGLKVRIAFVDASGVLHALQPIARDAVTSADVADVLVGHNVSATHSTRSGTALVEGRPTSNGGVFAVERRVDAVAPEERAIRRIVIALLIAGGIAAILGLGVAARLARPLRRTAAAAHALAAGRRDVSLRAEGPAEVVEVSDAINALSQALAQSEGRQREFLLSVSHDLRTPLTALSGYAESLAGGVVPADETAQVGAVMLSEAKRLERLVGDLLDLARLGAHDFRLEASRVDLNDVVRAAADVWITRCASNGIALQVEMWLAPLPVITDVGRIRQSLDGLFENALRVTPAGRPIVLASRAEGAAAVVEVRDGGPGLTDGDISVAFQQGELFRRYRGLREVGTGLGLTIVHGLVTRLGGTIEAGHAAEGGARFTVRLPLQSR